MSEASDDGRGLVESAADPALAALQTAGRGTGKISSRINKLLNECKARGIYDSRLGEIGRTMQAPEGGLSTGRRCGADGDRRRADKGSLVVPG